VRWLGCGVEFELRAGRFVRPDDQLQRPSSAPDARGERPAAVGNSLAMKSIKFQSINVLGAIVDWS
jgi:hypothetical protein